MFAIRTESLTKDFSIGFWRPRPYRALDGLNLEVAKAETFGFLGPNGAGKTTTLKLLMQLIYPTSGRAEILGRPVGDVGRQAPHRIPSRKPLLLRLPHRRRAARLLCPPVRLRQRRAAQARVDAARSGRHRRRAAAAAAKVLEGDDPARRHRAGAHQRSRSRVSRRADVRTRSAGTPRSATISSCRCAIADAPCSSARTCCRMPKRCVIAWPYSRTAGSWRTGGSPIFRRSTSEAGSSSSAA